MIGVLQPRHLVHVLGDDLRLAAFLGADARIGAGRVDQADDRQAVLRGQLHLEDRLAVALGMGTAEVAGAPFFVGAALLMADDQHLVLIELGEAGEDRPVVAKAAVAVQFDELVEHQREIVGRVGPVLVPGDLHDLPRRQVGIDLGASFRRSRAAAAQLFVLLRRTHRELFQRAATPLEFQDRLFKIETGRGCGGGAGFGFHGFGFAGGGETSVRHQIRSKFKCDLPWPAQLSNSVIGSSGGVMSAGGLGTILKTRMLRNFFRNSHMVGGRSSGFFAIILRIRFAELRRDVVVDAPSTDGIGAVRCLESSSSAVVPVNGGLRGQSARNSTQP